MGPQEISKSLKESAHTVSTVLMAMGDMMKAALLPGRQQVLAIDEANIDETALQLDAALLAAAPFVAAPAHCAFFPLQENGHRFVLARDGLYLEVRRPWLYFIQRAAEVEVSVTVPYGVVEPKTELAFGKLGTALPELQKFADHAFAASPIEAAGSVFWNSETKDWRFAVPEAISASPTGIRYKHIEPEPNEHLVIDLHSHGRLDAFFSTTDDADDAGSVKISGVYGNLDTGQPTLAFRICVLGLYIPLSVPADRVFQHITGEG